MSKIDHNTMQQIEAIKCERESIEQQKEKLDRQDWFLVDVTFTQESLADYQAQLDAYPEALAAWQKEQAAKTEKEKRTLANFFSEPRPPYPPSFYDDRLIIQRGPLTSCYVDRNPDGTSERVAIRACEFAALEQRPQIKTITVIDQGEKVAILVSEIKAQHLRELEERFARERDAQRPGAHEGALSRGPTAQPD